MRHELKSGIPQFDNAVEQFENGEINFLELTCFLWNTAYAIGKSEHLEISPITDEFEQSVCDECKGWGYTVDDDGRRKTHCSKCG